MPLLNTWVGEGKGKSTSSFGLLMRAWGQGFNILLVQFLKGKDACNYGEITTCKELNKIRPRSIDIIQSGSNKIVLPLNKTNTDIIEAENCWNELLKITTENKYDLIIIDELLPCLQLELLPLDDVFAWLKNTKKHTELVITGRIYSQDIYNKLQKISDLMSEVKCINHPFNTKCEICGIEFSYRYNYCPLCSSQLKQSTKARLGIEH